MDYKKLGTFIMVVGLIFAAVGGVKYFANLPTPPAWEQEAKEKAEKDPYGLAQGSLYAKLVDYYGFRKLRREQALKVVYIGGAIFLIGIGVFTSAKDTLTRRSTE